MQLCMLALLVAPRLGHALLAPHRVRRAPPLLAAAATNEPPRGCALLSLNARGVTKRAVAAAVDELGADNVFATKSLDEAHVAAKTIYDRRYDCVVACGGDGTLGALLRDLSREYDGLEAMPAIASLPLGTGNAVARYALGRQYRSWRGAGGVRKACAQIKRGVNATLAIPVLTTDAGELCFIAGQGFDAFLLDDYKRQAKATSKTFVGPVIASVWGYGVAMALRTLPAYLRGTRQMRVRVEALAPAAYVDPRRGDAALPVEPGVLYEGQASLACVGSTPFYGGGMRLFPFARSDRRGGGCHFRVAVMSPWRFVPNVLGIFKGTYRHDTLALDFVGDDFMVTLLDDKNYPLQHSGDDAGDRKSWRVSVAGAARFVDLLGMPAPLKNLELAA